MSKKIAYRIRNWKDYNRALVNRGNITLWFSEDVIKSWYAKPPSSPKRGRRFTYSDTYIELALTIRTLFRLSLRSTQGFIEGLTAMLGLNLAVSHYSSLSRRAAKLTIQLSDVSNSDRPIDIVVDSTGLKIYGEGEWKMRTHGKQKRRTWRKYHVSVNPATHAVTAMRLTESNMHDSKAFPALLEGQDNVVNVYADGAYPYKNCLDAIAKIGANPFIPIRSGTCLVKENASPGEEIRNQLILDINKAGGGMMWKKTSGYHKRSLVETHMYRLKTILGGSLKSRSFENQKIEALLMAKILNGMTKLGMPISEKIT